MAEKNLLILERSTSDLSTTKAADGSVILEGVFTQFGVRNKNNRIYEEQEVMPHIKELQEKVKTKKLLGELDHPKDFDISLSNVSHVIEDLSYDSANKQVKGRIRLLNTSKGKEAKALIEDGIPLHISSRAAGTVGDDGRVKIKKWFTYDLVADPGFENAELARVNESFGFDVDDNLFIYEIDKPIYKVQENKSKAMEQTYVTTEDFNKYTEYVKKTFESLEAGSKTFDQTKFEKLIEYTNKISSSVNEISDKIDSIEEGVSKNVIYSNYQTSEMNSLKEALENLTGYTRHVAEMSDKGIQYSDRVARDVDAVLENLIGYVGHVAEMSDKGIQYSDKLAEDVDSMLDKIVRYTNHLRESIENSINYTEHVVEEINSEYEKALMEKRGTIFSVTESANVISESTTNAASYKHSLNESIDRLINSAESKTKSDMVFMNFLSESRKREFSALAPEMKERVVAKMNEGRVMSNLDANRIWESCFIVEDARPDFISDMPAKYKEKWNALSEGRKKQLIAEAAFYPLTNAYQINNFWSTRDLRDKQVVMEKLTESSSIAAEPVQSQYSIDADRRADIVNRLKFNLGR